MRCSVHISSFHWHGSHQHVMTAPNKWGQKNKPLQSSATPLHLLRLLGSGSQSSSRCGLSPPLHHQHPHEIDRSHSLATNDPAYIRDVIRSGITIASSCTSTNTSISVEAQENSTSIEQGYQI
jgi:hypothetical protein